MQADLFLPAEWEQQSAVLLTWPHEDGDWGENFISVENNFTEIASHITQYEAVIINCRSESIQRGISDLLQNAGANLTRVHFVIVESNDVWARDHGPITVIHNGHPKLLDFTFNGWGGKYLSDHDNKISTTLHKLGLFPGTEIQHIDLVLEGGAIESNGEGVLLTTTGCLPLPSRNPGLSIQDIEARFKEYFGIHTVHWLNHGHLDGDDTDGHIDTIARFANSQTIIYQACENPGDEHHLELSKMREELAALRQPNGLPYSLHALPLPQPIYDSAGQRLPASYANFLIINNAVLMPSYNDPADAIAADVLANCFPDHRIYSIDCRALIHQYGSLHCVTMQIPAQVGLSKA